MDIETERMKIGIAADYTTTVYTNMLVLNMSFLITVFAILFGAFVANQLKLIEFVVPFVIIEALVVYLIIRQYEKFNRRTDYLDTLIEKIERNPPVSLGPLKSVLEELRKQ